SHVRLDETLEARGMSCGGPTLVLAGPLSGTPSPAADITIRVRDGAPDPGPLASAPAVSVELTGLTSDWVIAWAQVSELAGTHETADVVLSQLGDQARFAV